MARLGTTVRDQLKPSKPPTTSRCREQRSRGEPRDRRAQGRGSCWGTTVRGQLNPSEPPTNFHCRGQRWPGQEACPVPPGADCQLHPSVRQRELRTKSYCYGLTVLRASLRMSVVGPESGAARSASHAIQAIGRPNFLLPTVRRCDLERLSSHMSEGRYLDCGDPVWPAGVDDPQWPW